LAGSTSEAGVAREVKAMANAGIRSAELFPWVVPGGDLATHGWGTAAWNDRVRAALAALPPAQREALLLAYVGGYTQREVASLMGVPLGTVKTRMAAGMRRLKDALREPGREEQRPWTRR
jgi:DNA-directed RNA polymerase specialized sigma24 family protein